MSSWRDNGEVLNTQTGSGSLMRAQAEDQEVARVMEQVASILNEEEPSAPWSDPGNFADEEDFRIFNDPGAGVIHWGINE